MVRANRDHYRHWETRFHDYCLLEGYRNPAKDKTTDTENHYIAAKRPFELAVHRSAIPASEWNTLDDVIESKIPTNDTERPWVWLQKIKEGYVGATTLMQVLLLLRCKTDTTSGQKCRKQTRTIYQHGKPQYAPTYVQKCRQVLFNEYFIFDRVVCRFHITLYVTKFRVFW